MNSTTPFLTPARMMEIHEDLEIVTATLSYALNSMLIYLAAFRSTRVMREYSLIIILNCVVDMCFNTANLVTMTIVEMRDGHLFIFNTGRLAALASPWDMILSCVWLFSLFMVVECVAMNFLYRYMALCQSPNFTFGRFLLAFAGLSAMAAFHCFALTPICFQFGDKAKSFAPILMSNPFYANQTVEKFIVADSHTPLGMLHLLNAQVVVFSTYGVVFFAGYRVHRYLQETRSQMSRSTLAAQRQLTKIMVLQANYPVFVLVAPICTASGLSIARVNIDCVGLLCVTTVQFIPIINALSVVLIVPSYRRAVLSRRPWSLSKVSTTSLNKPSAGRSSTTENRATGGVAEEAAAAEERR